MFLRRFIERCQRGQALVEYMPTIAGAMALTTIAAIYIGGGVRESYCKIVDAVGDRPATCGEADVPSGDEIPSEGEDPSENEDPVVPDATCQITIDGGNWNSDWAEGETDTLRVAVANLQSPISWRLSLRFPSDPNSVDKVVQSGVIQTDGQYQIVVSYPSKNSWGPAYSDPAGKHEALATLSISDPCDSAQVERWYNEPWSADLQIGITHDVSPVKVVGETLTYTVTVTNNGPYPAQVYNGQGVIVNLPAPSDVTVLSATPSQGICDTLVACDLGEMPVSSSATINVVTTVGSPATCALTGTAVVSAPYPPDPDKSNNEASTIPTCELGTCVTTEQLGVATAFNTFTLGDHSSPSGSDTEGRMAVGGSATLGSYSVGYELSSAWTGKDVLIVGKNLKFTSGHVYYGNAVVGGTANVKQSATIEGSLLSGKPIDFTAAGNYLKSLSTAFANTEANGTATKQYCSMVLNGTDEELNVFEVDGATWGSMCELKLNIPSGSTALINITGTSVSFPGGGFFINGTSATPSSHSSSSISAVAKVLYNFPDATSVTIPWGGISGSMLAPKAKVTFNSGVIWGTMISGSFEGNGQLNDVPFQGCVPPLTQ